MASLYFFIFAQVFFFCYASSIRSSLRHAVITDPVILDEQALADYATEHNGTLDLHESCSAESSETCKFPYECLVAAQNKQASNSILQPISGLCDSSSEQCTCQLPWTYDGCRRSWQCDKFNRCASFVDTNACVSCTASLPSVASYVDDTNKRCESDTVIENRGLSMDSCAPDNDIQCADGYVCAKYPVLSNAKYSHCSENGACLTADPMILFQKCMDAAVDHCVCRRVHSAKITNSLKCSKSMECGKGQRCMQKIGEKLPTTVCHSCTAPAPAAKFAPLDDGMNHCDRKPEKEPPAETEPSAAKPNQDKPSTEKPDTDQPSTEKPTSTEPTSTDTTPMSPTTPDTSVESSAFTAVPSAESSPGTDGDDGDDETEGSTAPCIAVSALSDFEAHKLVFSEHVRAGVLCDNWGSCATPGHIVVHQSKAMMMRTYCANVSGGCSRRVMLVNSPRIAIGLKVKSTSPDLHYTALSAQYETAVEEFVLSVIVRGGV